ncbi:MAG: energy coupling factor transporter S component ThiW [Synergistales bacterium]|nr:energy coupling factor transporter S component ThiW [Synergistales bacterium]
MRNARLRRLTIAGLLAGTAVLLSGVAIPVGPTRCFPFQHAVNAVAGVLLGPWWAAGCAFVSSLVRNMIGTGTPFAFPGSIPGALAVGFAARILRRDWAAFAEPLGTGPVGATLSALLIGPAMGGTMGVGALMAAFLASSVPGALLGFLALVNLRKLGVLRDTCEG